MYNIFKQAAEFLDRAPDLWKEDVELIELNRRFLWFLILRFGVAVSLLALGTAKGVLIPHLNIAPATLITVAGILVVINVFHWFYYEWAVSRRAFPASVRAVAGNVEVQIIADFLILGFLVYECGGVESPLIYFFLFHDTLSCLFFSRRLSFIHTLISVSIILSIYFLMSCGVLPERHFINPEFSSEAFICGRFAEYYLTGVVSVYLVAWYLISTITQSLKKRESELQDKIQEMLDLAREKTRYLLITTHELKAPFAAIQSYANVALAGYAGEMSPKIKGIMQKISARCDLLSNMIIGMIQLANITSIKEHADDIVKSSVDLSQMILSAIARLKESAAARGVNFRTASIAKSHYFIEANPQQIDILIGNVVGNAVSYSYPNTTIEISAEKKEKTIEIAVKDHGIGIKKEHLDRVFLEYFRSEKAAEINPNSTGLGLTIARQIMNINGGNIRIESVEGSGTQVYMEFPNPKENLCQKRYS